MLVLDPPRCLGAFTAAPSPDPGIPLDAVVDEWPNRFFSLACECRGNAFAVGSYFSPHYYLENECAYGPIALRCSTCALVRQVFDPTLDGYDVELDHFPPWARYAGTLKEYACAHCAAQSFTLVARFQYPASVLEPVPGQPGHEGLDARNLFSYFTLIGTCAGCQTVATIASVECS